ncbi:MAG TPA: sigma 54-interacting transcriptional regulator, partial [Cytophagales bacterium]|nr:sigma 54-interacting transcriptional regulator [Cytophagales bacterium]
DDRVIHFGLIPRSHRGIFVINELPDLQARIQVSLFNILQEGDIQIRGFKLRLPLDIQFVFTANPEDYTNRGSIITPLKDRIDSQIITHYPLTIEVGKAITKQEAHVKAGQDKVLVPELLHDLIEQVAIEGRESEYVDPKSGVSARLTISAMETLLSAAERRMLVNNESTATVRITDLWAVVPAITGKVELVYEGEQEGTLIVAQNLIGKAIRNRFLEYFPDPEQSKKEKGGSIYSPIIDWFAEGKFVDLYSDMPEKEFSAVLYSVPGLYELASEKIKKVDKVTILLYMEFVLYALAEFSQISRTRVHTKVTFKDLMNSMLGGIDFEDLEDDE